MVGGTFAALHQTIQTASDAHQIYSDEVNPFGFVYTEDSGAIDADISLVDTPTNISTALVVENIGSIPAQYAFYVNRSTVGPLDPENPIWDETLVTVSMTVDEGIEQWNGTLREFLNTAFVTNDVLEPGATGAVTVAIYPALTSTWGSEDYAAAVDVDFATRFTFNQIGSGLNSALYNYALNNGEQRNESLRFDVHSNMEKMWAIPSSDIQIIDY